jgi:hypothetical protein
MLGSNAFFDGWHPAPVLNHSAAKGDFKLLGSNSH